MRTPLSVVLATVLFMALALVGSGCSRTAPDQSTSAQEEPSATGNATDGGEQVSPRTQVRTIRLEYDLTTPTTVRYLIVGRTGAGARPEFALQTMHCVPGDERSRLSFRNVRGARNKDDLFRAESPEDEARGYEVEVRNASGQPDPLHTPFFFPVGWFPPLPDKPVKTGDHWHADVPMRIMWTMILGSFADSVVRVECSLHHVTDEATDAIAHSQLAVIDYSYQCSSELVDTEYTPPKARNATAFLICSGRAWFDIAAGMIVAKQETMHLIYRTDGPALLAESQRRESAGMLADMIAPWLPEQWDEGAGPDLPGPDGGRRPD